MGVRESLKMWQRLATRTVVRKVSPITVGRANIRHHGAYQKAPITPTVNV